MFNIDFGTLPEASRKNIAPAEITALNGLFMDPTIQQQLENIEEQRKIRQKWKYVIYGGCTVLALSLSFIFGSSDNIFLRLVDGFFFTIGEGDNSFAPVIWSTIISYSIGIGTLYNKFASKIEIPLKSEVLKKMCPLLYSKLEYSYDEKYSFDELETLRSKNFIRSYDTIDCVEDSIHFDVENDGKAFSVNGFELETSEVKGSGKNRRRVTTNHCYLMKATFPNARIPLTSDLFIRTDYSEKSFIKKIIIPMIIGIMGISIIYSITSSAILSYSIGGLIMWLVYYEQSASANDNRVQLENIEFEKLFDVKCEDQVTSRMIITPAFMDRIVSFVNKTGNKYEFLMQGNIMYIKRQIQGTYLETGTEKNMLSNVAGFTQFYTDMREIIQFVYDMNLMYLSKTDTSKTIEQGSNSNTINPISIGNKGNHKSGFFGGILSRYGLST